MVTRQCVERIPLHTHSYPRSPYHHRVRIGLNGSEGPTGSNLYLGWHGPTDEVWLDETHLPRAPLQSLLTMQRVQLDAVRARVSLYAYIGTPGGTVRYVRAIAVDTAALASLTFGRDDGVVATSSNATTFPVDLVPVAAGTQHVYVGSLRMREVCGAPDVTDAERATELVFAGSSLMLHATNNCSNTVTYGDVQLLDGPPPARAAIGYASAVSYRGAQVAVLGLR